MQLWLTPSTGELSLSDTAQIPVARIHAKSGTVFELQVFSTEPLDVAAGGVLTAKSKGAYLGNLAAIDSSWTASGTDPVSYLFELDLFTEEVESLFSGEVSMVPLMAEITWTSGTQHGKSQTFDLLVGRQVWRGDEQVPTPASVQYPIVIFLEDVPANKTDFFMFDGGVAPVAGLYQSEDSRYTYTIKGGQTEWRRTPISAW